MSCTGVKKEVADLLRGDSDLRILKVHDQYRNVLRTGRAAGTLRRGGLRIRRDQKNQGGHGELSSNGYRDPALQTQTTPARRQQGCQQKQQKRKQRTPAVGDVVHV